MQGHTLDNIYWKITCLNIISPFYQQVLGAVWNRYAFHKLKISVNCGNCLKIAGHTLLNLNLLIVLTWVFQAPITFPNFWRSFYKLKTEIILFVHVQPLHFACFWIIPDSSIFSSITWQGIPKRLEIRQCDNELSNLCIDKISLCVSIFLIWISRLSKS